MDIAEKVIEKAADIIKVAPKETENPIHTKDEPVVQSRFVSARTDFCSTFICLIIDFLTVAMFFCCGSSSLF